MATRTSTKFVLPPPRSEKRRCVLHLGLSRKCLEPKKGSDPNRRNGPEGASHDSGLTLFDATGFAGQCLIP